MTIFKNWFKKIIIPGRPFEVSPDHLAIIMDGNGRWAKQKGLPRTAGHRVGMERARDAVEVCLEAGIKYLTLYAFSTENWNRPAEEVDFLMNLFETTLQKEVEKIHQRNVRIRFLGIKQKLNPSLVEMMDRTEKLTLNNQALTLNIAINYGGRTELISAIKGIMRAVQKRELDPDQFSEEELAARLFTAGQPDPDLLIRPGGERRISNFFVWQLAYTELYFSDLYWPDFGKEEMIQALKYYSRRERRFGRVKGVNHRDD